MKIFYPPLRHSIGEPGVLARDGFVGQTAIASRIAANGQFSIIRVKISREVSLSGFKFNVGI